MNKQTHYKIWKAIKEFHVRQAIDMLRSEITSLPSRNQFSNELDNIESTYSLMTGFMMSGQPDSSREKVLNGILNRLHILNDKTLREEQSATDSSQYYYALRMNRFSHHNLAQLIANYREKEATSSLARTAGSSDSDVERQKEEALSNLFDYIFTMFDDKEDFSILRKALLSPSADFDFQASAVGALSLGLNIFYSSESINLLLDIFEQSSDEKVKARSLTGIVLALSRFPYRVSIDDKLISRLTLWQDSDDIYRQLRDVVRNIVATRDTDRVADKMKNEVIPEIMKISPDIMKNMRQGFSIDSDGNLENNPEWQELLDRNGVSDKLRELQDLQSEGADIMMTTFSQLKNFPFFNRISNWFLPFSPYNSTVSIEDESYGGLLENLFELQNMMCDSDKYSLALTFQRMPDAQKKMAMAQFEANSAQMAEAVKEMQSKSSTPVFDLEVTKYVRDLFRFFRLYKNRQSFSDPFSKPFDFLEIPIIGEMMKNEEMLGIISEFYFKRGFYLDALGIFIKMESYSNTDHFYWEKRGYCHHALKDYKSALECYTKAEIFSQPGKWLTEKLAIVNRRLGRWDDAASYYSRLLEKDPENVKLLFNYGDMLLNSGEYDEALRQFYHGEYLSPDNIKLQRAVAWGELMRKNYDKAAEYYDRLLAKNPEASDYINAAHISLINSNFSKATELYLHGASLLSEPITDFENTFKSDKDILLSGGIDETTLNIFLDEIIYRIKSR